MKSLQTVDRSVRVLELLSEASRGLKLSQMAVAMDIKSQTLLGIIRALQVNKLVIQASPGGVYMLGPKLQLLHETWLDNNGDQEIYQQMVEKLYYQINENVIVASLEAGQLKIIAQKSAFHEVQVRERPVDASSLHTYATGKLLLAFSDDFHKEQILGNINFKKQIPNAITNRKVLEADMAEIVKDNVSLCNQEGTVGLFAIAVPIFDNSGQVRSALGVSLPVSRYSTDVQNDVLTKLKETSKEISKYLYAKEEGQ